MFIEPNQNILTAFQNFDWMTAANEAASWRAGLATNTQIANVIRTHHWFIQELGAAQEYIYNFSKTVPGIVRVELSLITPGFHYEQPAAQDSGTWCHVPLLVPQDTTNLWISSDGEQRTWQVGTLLCIPRSAEYVAHNTSSGSRVVLRLELSS